MPEFNSVILRQSSTAGLVPDPVEVLQGELAINLADRKLYSKNSAGSVIYVAADPAGTAGGDLQGTYPNPTVHKVYGVNMQSGTPIDGDLWQYHAANTRWRHRTFNNLLGDNGIGWDGTTMTVGALVLGNGEFLSNGTNGTLKLGVNGTNALEYSMLVDGTSWGYGVKLSTSQNSNTSNASAGFWFVSPLQMSTGVPFSFDAAQTSVMQHVGAFTGTRLATHLSVSLGTLSQYGGQDSSGALCVVDHAALGAANRRPAVTHTDPTLYVYARGSSNATHFVRMNHDTTDGYLESGAGRLILSGATGVRIDGAVTLANGEVIREASTMVGGAVATSLRDSVLSFTDTANSRVYYGAANCRPTGGGFVVTANRAYYVPIYLPTTDAIRQIRVIAQTTTITGNCIMGLYSDAGGKPGTRLQQTSSTAVAGSFTWTTVAVNWTPPKRGWHWMAVVFDSTPTMCDYDRGLITATIQGTINWPSNGRAAFGESEAVGSYSLPSTAASRIVEEGRIAVIEVSFTA